jgi:hypothetical protein
LHRSKSKIQAFNDLQSSYSEPLFSSLLEQLEKAQGKKISFETVRVQLIRIDGMPFGVPRVSAKNDGSFELENAAPDRHRIGVFNLPQGDVWLKSIRAGDR